LITAPYFIEGRFPKLGLIECNGRIQVHKSLLNVILNDPLPDDKAEKTTRPRGLILKG